MGFLLGCTALMRANSPKHPPGCLQFAEMGKEKGKKWLWKKLGRREGKDRKRVCLCICTCVCLCVRVHVCLCMCMWVYGCVGASRRVCLCVCMCARMPNDSDYTCAYVALCTICMRVGGCNTVIEL